jgi:hypothetical protein
VNTNISTSRPHRRKVFAYNLSLSALELQAFLNFSTYVSRPIVGFRKPFTIRDYFSAGFVDGFIYG